MNDLIKPYKIVMIGNSGVGKSTLAAWYSLNYKPDALSQTVGASFFSKIIVISEKRIRIDIWDTAGQERFHSIAKLYYNNTIAAVCMFDVTNYSTFKDLDFWLNDYQQVDNKKSKIIIVANKIDQPKESWQITDQEIEKFVKDNNHQLVYTNCVTGEGINKVFDIILNHILGLDDDNYKSKIINLMSPKLFIKNRICSC